MTIIQPHKNRPLMRFLLLLFILLAGGGAFCIFEYNAVAEARQGIATAKEAVVEAQASNADLKDAFYRMIDPGVLRAAAAGGGLTLVRDPQYLQSAPWLSALSR
ncbi:MAG: hypothetical protein V1656_02510 [Candidatus Jorgensenbacteria bacterium]